MFYRELKVCDRRDLPGVSDFSRFLSDQRSSLKAAFKGATSDGALADLAEREYWSYLPRELQDKLVLLRTGEVDLLHIRGLSFGRGTEASANKIECAVHAMAFLNLMLGAAPLRNDKNEIRVDMVSPESKTNPKQILGAGPLEYSNDAMAAARVPDFGAIACVTPDPKARWQFVKASELVGALYSSAGHDAVHTLMCTKFWFAEGSVMRQAVEAASHVHKQPDHPSMKLIKEPYRVVDGFGLRYSQDSAGMTQDAQAALDAFRSVLLKRPDLILSLNLQAGDIVLRSNPTTIYGRTACEKFGGNPEDRPHWVRQRAAIPAAP